MTLIFFKRFWQHPKLIEMETNPFSYVRPWIMVYQPKSSFIMNQHLVGFLLSVYFISFRKKQKKKI